MAETSSLTETAGVPTRPPPTPARRERGVQLIGAGFVGTSLALFAGACYDFHLEIPAAMFCPLALCLGVTWIVVGRVSPITCLWGLVGIALTSLTVYLVALKYVGV